MGSAFQAYTQKQTMQVNLPAPPQTINGRAKYLRDRVAAMAREAYREMRSMDVAKECARVVLPEGLTLSRLYVNGTLRSWLHYLDVRDDPGVTQWEHVVLAREIRAVLEPVFPAVFGVLEPEHV